MFTGLGKLDDLLGDNFVGEIATLFKSERDAGQFIYDANDAFGISIEPLDAKVSLDQGEIEAPPVRTAGLQLFPTGGPRNVRPNNSVSCAGFRRSARVVAISRDRAPGQDDADVSKPTCMSPPQLPTGKHLQCLRVPPARDRFA